MNDNREFYIDPASFAKALDEEAAAPEREAAPETPEVTEAPETEEQTASETPTAPEAPAHRGGKIAKVVSVALVMLLFAIVAFLLPLRPTESVVEKRKLAAFPAFSFEALFSGDYFDGISAWFSDTVPFRDTLVSVNAKVRSLLGTNTAFAGFNEGVKGDDIPDVPVKPADDATTDAPTPGDETTTAPEPTTEEPTTEEPETGIVQELSSVLVYGNAGFEYYNFVQSTADAYVRAISSAAERLDGQATVFDMIIPTSMDITLDPRVRKTLSVSDQQKAIAYMEGSMSSKVKVVSIFDEMKSHPDEYLYFRTDHHWTGLAAYYAYVKFCEVKGITPISLGSDCEYRAFDGFLGSFYNDSGQNPALAESPDTVETWMPKRSVDFTIHDANGNVSHGPVIFDETNAPAGLKYGAFIWGDNPFSVIENLDMEEGESLLLVKESFGNAIAPLFCAHYKYVYIMDYRYFNGTVAGLVAEKGITDVLYCNNISMTRASGPVNQIAGKIG